MNEISETKSNLKESFSIHLSYPPDSYIQYPHLFLLISQCYYHDLLIPINLKSFTSNPAPFITLETFGLPSSTICACSVKQIPS
mmetsp:Transcript_40002/g.68241  ORF Transcript_40002/g.68241 Transcript_40002/m.68241 type:complete len:84 (-) Transcript_40002:499-750(-)